MMLLLKIVLGSCREKGKAIFSVIPQNETKKKKKTTWDERNQIDTKGLSSSDGAVYHERMSRMHWTNSVIGIVWKRIYT